VPDVYLEVLAHCLLNPLVRVKGLNHVSYSPSGPVLQLPCPEALYMGLDRWAVTRNQIDVPEFRRFCRSLLERYADLIEMMASKGMIVRIIGLRGSPSCGVETTSAGYKGGRVREQAHEHVHGPGVLIEELTKELSRRKILYECSEI